MAKRHLRSKINVVKLLLVNTETRGHIMSFYKIEIRQSHPLKGTKGHLKWNMIIVNRRSLYVILQDGDSSKVIHCR